MRKEGLLKRLKSIKDTDKKQSKMELEAFKNLIFLNEIAANAKKTLHEYMKQHKPDINTNEY